MGNVKWFLFMKKKVVVKLNDYFMKRDVKFVIKVRINFNVLYLVK